MVRLPGFGPTITFDYNGVGMYDGTFKGLIGEHDYFEDLAGLRRLTRGAHSIVVGPDVFAADVPCPYPPVPDWDTPDLRLAPGSVAVDAALTLPNINDHFNGSPIMVQFDFRYSTCGSSLIGSLLLI